MSVIGLWEVEGDFTTPWTFEAWSPNGTLIDTETFNWDNDPYHYFDFTATTAGEYVLRAIHVSLYTRDLTMEIIPAGWRLKEARTG